MNQKDGNAMNALEQLLKTVHHMVEHGRGDTDLNDYKQALEEAWDRVWAAPEGCEVEMDRYCAKVAPKNERDDRRGAVMRTPYTSEGGPVLAIDAGGHPDLVVTAFVRALQVGLDAHGYGMKPGFVPAWCQVCGWDGDHAAFWMDTLEVEDAALSTDRWILVVGDGAARNRTEMLGNQCGGCGAEVIR